MPQGIPKIRKITESAIIYQFFLEYSVFYIKFCFKKSFRILFFGVKFIPLFRSLEATHFFSFLYCINFNNSFKLNQLKIKNKKL